MPYFAATATIRATSGTPTGGGASTGSPSSAQKRSSTCLISHLDYESLFGPMYNFVRDGMPPTSVRTGPWR